MATRDRAVGFARKPFYSPREYAELAGIDPSTVMDQIHGGDLYAVRLSERIYRIPLAQVLAKLYPEELPEFELRESKKPERDALPFLRRIAAEPRAYPARGRIAAKAAKKGR